MQAVNYQVLLVEDDTSVMHLLHRILDAEGEGLFSISHAQDLNHAMSKLKGQGIDVVLLDLNLPDSAGIETFNTIHNRYPDVPVVILSGESDEHLAVEALQHGVQDYLVKGRESGHAITRALRHAIERKHYEDEKKQLEAMLHQERRLEALGVMASGIAHEINTPLQFIGTNIQFMKHVFDRIEDLFCEINTTAKLDPQHGEYSTTCHRLFNKLCDNQTTLLRKELPKAIRESIDGMNRVKGIIRAMNVFSRNTYRQQVLYDINLAVRDALNISRHEWKYLAEVKTTLDESLPMIPCFPEELCQCLLNLIVNSVHAIQARNIATGEKDSAPKGLITITTSRNCRVAEIRVADSGSGIPENIRDRIFEPFFTTKEVGRGSGQGLAIVYDVVVRKHHGTVDFISKVDQGTVFKITLPFDGTSDASNNRNTGANGHEPSLDRRIG